MFKLVHYKAHTVGKRAVGILFECFLDHHMCVGSFTADEGLDMKHLRSSRRSRLPAPRPDTGDFSLWGLLRKNIGKDLSKISMPVSLNEPLSMLQVLYTHTPVQDLHTCVSE